MGMVCVVNVCRRRRVRDQNTNIIHRPIEEVRKKKEEEQ